MKENINKHWFMLFMSSIAIITMYISYTGYSLASGEIMEDAGLNYTQLGTLASAASLSGGVVVLFAWLAIGKYGPKKIGVLALLFCTVGLLIFGIAQTYFWLIVSRMIQGIGISLCFCAPYTLASNWFEGKKHASVCMGVLMACDGFGTFFALYVYAIVIQSTGWRTGTLIGAAIVFVVAVIFAITTKDSPGATRDEKVENGLASYYFNIIKKKNVIPAALFITGLWGSYSVAVYWVPTVLMEDAGWSVGAAGLTGTLYALAGIFSALGCGPVSDKMGKRKPLAIFGGILFFVSFAISAVAVVVGSYVVLAIMLPLGGFAAYIGQPLLYTMVSETVKEDEASAAIGFIQGVGLILGACVYPAVIGMIKDATDGYFIGFIVVAASILILNVIAIFPTRDIEKQ